MIEQPDNEKPKDSWSDPRLFAHFESEPRRREERAWLLRRLREVTETMNDRQLYEVNALADLVREGQSMVTEPIRKRVPR